MNAATVAPGVTLSYLVCHGKCGALGTFTAETPLGRGDRVIVDSARGLEVGTVRGQATARQASLLGTPSSGRVLRQLTAADEQTLADLRELGERLFAAAREQAHGFAGVEVLDVDMLWTARAIVQYLSKDAAELEDFARSLSQQFALDVRLENLALPHEEHEHGGCDKPDCGRQNGGGCTTCSTGGGCSSCGTGKVDMRQYFGHLRAEMEKRQRTPLL